MKFSTKFAPPKVLVVGAGLIGLSTAEALRDYGAEVTVIEARKDVMRGTSYSNSGMLHPSQSRSWLPSGDESFDRTAAKAVFDLARQSLPLLMQNFEQLGLTEITGRPQGCYQIYEESNQARQAQKKYSEIGVDTHLMSDAKKTLGHLALYFPSDYSGNAFLYGRAIAARLKARGVEFIYGAKGLRLRPGRDGITAQLKGHIFHCDHVVICSGPQSVDLMASVGLKLMMSNRRGYAVNFERPDMDIPEVPLMEAKSRSALTVFGSTLRLSGTLGEASAHPLLRRWYEIAPEIMMALKPAKEVWSGLRPISAVGRPYISDTPIDGLWINTGHGHMGWTLSAGSGALMADMIMQVRTDKRFAFPG